MTRCSFPGGKQSVDRLKEEMDAIHFVNEAFKHCKAIAATGEAVDFIGLTFAGKAQKDTAVILSNNGANDAAENFIKAIAEHRNWARETARKVPA